MKIKESIKIEFLKQANALADRVEQKESQMTDGLDAERSWQAVERRVVEQSLQKSRSKRSTWWYGVAASLVLACGLGYITFSGNTMESDLLSALGNMPAAESVQEGLLQVDDVTIRLCGDNRLRYDAEGNITINDKRILLRKSDDKSAAYNVLIVPKGEKYAVTLSDNTKIYVNSGTKIAFPTRFDKSRRCVAVDGEAIFDVSKDASRPFVVSAAGFEVKVLGTVFDVSAYQSEGRASVVLIEGRVSVTTDDDATMELLPNQRVEIERDYMSLQEVDVAPYVAWRYDMMCLDGKTLRALFAELSDQFGYDIEFSDQIGRKIISGKLDMSGNFATIMDNLSLLMDLDYRIEADKIVVTEKP